MTTAKEIMERARAAAYVNDGGTSWALLQHAVSTLVGRRDELEAERDALKLLKFDADQAFAGLLAEFEALKAKIEGMERQEPFAFIASKECRHHGWVDCNIFQENEFTIPLYLAPGAKEQP